MHSAVCGLAGAAAATSASASSTEPTNDTLLMSALEEVKAASPRCGRERSTRFAGNHPSFPSLFPKSHSPFFARRYTNSSFLKKSNDPGAADVEGA